MDGNKSIGERIRNHIAGFRPPARERRASVDTQNVFKALRGLTAMQWITFICGWLAWT